MCRTRLAFALLVAAAPAFAQSVDSIDAVPPRVAVMPAVPFVGAAQHRLALTVPAWRGLEPALAITYSSSSRNGWIGAGMTLEGVSMIERVSATRGAPRYDATDTYLLDGEPLLSCVAGSASPSCTSGGTHATKRERHTRIVKVGTAWTVTSPTGVVSRYTTLVEPFAVLTSRTDTVGNAVAYSYTTVNGTSYLATITYNGTTITFAREVRSDVLSAGTGTGLRRVDQRLVAIAIRTDGVLDRAYRLTYASTGTIGRSFLARVQEYGSDATINAAGAVTGGSALPPTTFAYNADPPALTSPWYSGQIATPTGSRILYDDAYVTDVDGDGRGDAVVVSAQTTGGVTVTGQLELLVRLGLADGTFSTTSVRSTTTATAEIGWYEHVRTGDVNGDGRADFVFVRTQTTYPCCSSPTGSVDVQLALGTATGGFTFPTKQRISSEGYSGEYDHVALPDLDGNGRADLVLVRLDSLGSGFYGDVTALVSLSAGTSFPIASKRTLANLDDNTSWGSMRVHAGDVDGDGRDDLVLVQRGSSLCNYSGAPDRAYARAFVSAGAGAFSAGVLTTLTSSCSDSYTGDTLADINGDGLADLVGDQAVTVYGAICSDCDGDVTIVANLGYGNGRFGAQVSSVGWSGAGIEIGKFVGTFVDVNGDGFADRIATRAERGDVYLLTSYGRGDGRFTSGNETLLATAAPTWWTNSGAMLVGDIDGDGRFSPIATFSDNNEWHLIAIRPSAPSGGLLATATLPSGGSVQFGYTTSSSFTNGYLPFAFPVLGSTRLLDGRGQIATTTYGYTGGLYVPSERRFFGFATARITDPTGAFHDIAYTQHVADPDGTIATTHARTSAGALVRYEATAFVRGGNGTTTPYTSNPARRHEYECNGLTVCKARSRGWTYSAYGAIASEIEYGDDAIAGDERTTFRTQVANATAFITQLDATIVVRAGAGVATGTQLARTELAYDGAATSAAPTRGLLTTKSRWRGGSAYVVERSQFDAAGNEIVKLDPLGVATSMTYDSRHRLVTTTNALGHAETRAYDTLGRTTSIIDANGGVTQHVYDAFGRLVRRTTPDGGVATAAFTSWGSASAQFVTTTIEDGTTDGLWTRTYVDGLGRTVRVIGEGGITTDTTYDARGLVQSVSAPYLTGATPAWTTTTYDAVGRPVRVTEPDGAAVVTTYGNWSVSTTDHRGLVTDKTYDGYQQLVQVVERTPAAQTTTIAYDLLGQRVAITDANGNATTAVFDPLGRRTQARDPDLGTWQYTYDDAGRITRQRDARGVAIDVTYDVLGRPLQRHTGTTTLATFSYDLIVAGAANVGRLTRFTDPTGATRRDYDLGGRLRAEAKTIGTTTYRLAWTYDVVGRVATIRYPDVGGVREQVTVSYDTSGRTNSVGSYVGGVAYDARGNVTAATYGNAATVARTYAPARGWLLSQTVTAGAVVRDHFAVVRSGSGDVIGRTSNVEARDAWLFSYDRLGRLTGADNTVNDLLDEDFTYNMIGNRLTASRDGATATYTYPTAGAARPHAPTTIGGASVRYDANGNRLGIGAAADAIYDADNRMISDGTTTYAYDAEGTRVRAGTAIFVRDLFEASGTASWRYYYLGRERVARRDATGSVTYYHADSIGTVRALTSATGTIAGKKRSFAFGELAAATGLADPFALAGQRLDGSGLYHMGARMMDPAHGQFTQPDPSSDPDPARPQTLNRYSYAYNNPIRISDPTGFQGADDVKPPPPSVAADEDDPYRIRILRNTPEGLRWTWGGGAVPIDAPRLYSNEFYAQPGVKTGRGRIDWAFESRTGRLYANHSAYSGQAFETMNDALRYIDQLRDEVRGVRNGVDQPRYDHRNLRLLYDARPPQYLESDSGDLYRYYDGGTLERIQPGDVPATLGTRHDQVLFIFREALLS